MSRFSFVKYWVYRGPRLFVLLIIVIVVTFVVFEVVEKPSIEQRLSRILQNLTLLITSAIMLYYRLPDSIDSAICRSAHDFYVKSKMVGSLSESPGLGQENV